MNGMVYIRGDRLDYDGWAYHGYPGWSYEDVLPLFRRSEDFDRGESEAHGVGGPLHVTTRYEPHPLLAAMQEACLEAGIPFNADHNDGGELDGVGPAQLTIRDGRRHTAAVAFLHPILDHPNLTVLTDARALGLRSRARAAPASRSRATARSRGPGGDRARSSLSAGSLESPRLLMLAGIGPAEELARHGIAVARRPAGRRRQPARPRTSRRSCTRVAGRGAAVRPGLQHHHVHLFWRSRPGLRAPDTQPVMFHLPFGADWLEMPARRLHVHAGPRAHRRAAAGCASRRPTRPRRSRWTRARCPSTPISTRSPPRSS